MTLSFSRHSIDVSYGRAARTRTHDSTTGSNGTDWTEPEAGASNSDTSARRGPPAARVPAFRPSPFLKVFRRPRRPPPDGSIAVDPSTGIRNV
ncbi:unnamed protein product, partial [Nesidiocoris tenuis]